MMHRATMQSHIHYSTAAVMLGLLGMLSSLTTAECKAVSDANSECNPRNNRFLPGWQYKYRYAAQTESSILGTSDSKSGMKIDCILIIESRANCQMILKTTQCQLRELSTQNEYKFVRRSKSFAEEMQRHPVMFSLQHGQLRDAVVSSHVNESIVLLNIKRGIISGLQLYKPDSTPTYHTVKQANVHGFCDVSLRSSSGGDKPTITTQTDLKTCRSSQKMSTSFLPISLLRSSQQTYTQAAMKPLKSSHNCAYRLKRNAEIREAECTEDHLLIPFSNVQGQRSGVNTQIKQWFKYVSKESLRGSSPHNIPESHKQIKEILYEFEETEQYERHNIKVVMTKFFSLVSDTIRVKKTSPQQFASMVSVFRSLKTPQMKVLIVKVLEKVSCRGPRCDVSAKSTAESLLRDLLLSCGSHVCVRGLLQLASSDGRVSGPGLQTMLYSMALHYTPDPRVISDLTLFCKKSYRTRTCHLTLAALVNRYAEENPSFYTESQNEVFQTITYLKSSLGTKCHTSTDTSDKSLKPLVFLQALGNIGWPVQIYDQKISPQSSILTKILNCITEREAPKVVSLEAIQALRRMKTNELIQTSLMSIMNNSDNEVQVRISAYSMLMKHVDGATMTQVLAYVQNEKLNQIKTFILSSIRNIIDSNDQSQQVLRQLILSAIDRSHIALSDITLSGSLDAQSVDFNKHVYLPFFNQTVAGQLNGNLVYDPSSYIPRSGMLNATVNMFGKSINLFELGLSAKGFEPIVEALFGPNGYMHQDSWLDLLDMNKMRSRPLNLRQAQTTFSHFKRRIVRELETLHLHISRSMHTSQDGSVYLKVLGHELGFGTLDDLFSFLIGGDDMIQLASILRNLARGQSFSAGSKFLEATLTMPTSIGVPLTITGDGTYVLMTRLKAMPGKTKMSVAGSVSFSGAVDYISSISTSVAGAARSGVEIKASALLNATVTGTAALSNGRVAFEAENIKDQMQILHFSSSLSLINSKGRVKINGPSKTATRGSECSSGVLTRLTGLTFCTDYSYHSSKAPYIPLSGPLVATVTTMPAYKHISTLKYATEMTRKSSLTGSSRHVTLTVPGVAVQCELTSNDRSSKARQMVKCEHGQTLNTANSPLFIYESQVRAEKEGFYGKGANSNRIGNQATEHYHSDWTLVLPPGALYLQNSHSVKPGKRYTRIFNVTYKCLDMKKGINIQSQVYTKVHVDLEAKLNSASGLKTGHLAELVVQIPGQNIQALYIGQRTNATYNADAELSWVHSHHHMHENHRYKRSLSGALEYVEESISDSVEKVKESMKTFLANGWHRRQLHNAPANNLLNKDGLMNDASTARTSTHRKSANLKLILSRTVDDPTKWWQSNGLERYAYQVDVSYPWGTQRPTIHAEGALVNNSHSLTNQRWHVNSDISHSALSQTMTGKLDVQKYNKKFALKQMWRTKDPQGQVLGAFNSSLRLEARPLKIVYSHQMSSPALSNNMSTIFIRSSNGRTMSLSLNGKGSSTASPLLNYEMQNKVGIDSTVWNSEGSCSLPVFKSMNRYRTFWSNDKAEANFNSIESQTQKSKCEVKYKWNKATGSTLSLTLADGYDIQAKVDYAPVKTLNVTVTSLPNKQSVLSTQISLPTTRLINITVYHIDKGVSMIPMKSMEGIFRLNENETLSANIIFSGTFKQQMHRFAANKWNQMKTNMLNFKKDHIALMSGVYGWTVEAYGCTAKHLHKTLSSIKNGFIGWVFHYYEFGDFLLDKLNPYLQSTLRGDIVQKIVGAVHRNLFSIQENNIYLNIITQPFTLDNSMSLPRLSDAYYSWLSNMNGLWKKVSTGYLYHQKHTAMIYGSGHVVTFDGRFFELPDFPNKDCTYMMARDFVDRNFTILKNKKTITVLTKEVAVIFTGDGKVMLNNSNESHELPVQSWDGKVKVRRHNNHIELTTTYGLSVSCDTSNKQCTIQISGWYHNRTLGLLGTNDHELSNDFRKRDGRVTSSVYDFMNSYEVTGMRVCRALSGNSRITRESGCLSAASTKCQQLFSEKTSPLSSCFGTVDPKPYQEACVLDTSKCEVAGDETMKKVCESASAYVKMCHVRGHHVRLNTECSSCNGRKVDELWTERIGRKVDVVIVTSLQREMSRGGSSSSASYLRPLVHAIQQKLRTAGHLQYGLVGFAGQGVQAKEHIRTLNGKLFENHWQLQKQLKMLNTDGDASMSASDALRLAAEYPWRPDASHAIVLITESDKQNTNIDHELMSELRERGITVYTLSKYQELNSDNVLGMDWNNAPIVNNRSPKITKEVSLYPQGEFAQFSKVTKGCIFNLDLLMTPNRQLIHSIAKHLHFQVAKERRRCRQCSCSWSLSNQNIQRCHWSEC